KDGTVSLYLPTAVHQIAMGAASRGPLLLRHGDQFMFLDAGSLSPRVTGPIDYGANFSNAIGRGIMYRAAPDGQPFGGWEETLHPSGMHLPHLQGNKPTYKYQSLSVGYVLPTDDGTLVTGIGLFTADGKPRPGDIEEPEARLRVPAQLG